MDQRIRLDHHDPIVTSPDVEALYAAFGAEKRDLFFPTHSQAEAVGGVLLSYFLESLHTSGRNHLLTTAVEETSFHEGLKRLEGFGAVAKILPVNAQGQLTRAILESLIRPRSALLSLSWANALTGVIHPIWDLADVCKEKGIALHVDVSSALGKIYFRFADLDVRFLSFEGGVFAKQGAHFSPLVMGKKETSTSPSVPQEMEAFDHLCTETARLRDLLEKGIVSQVPESRVLFAEADRLPDRTVIVFSGVAAEALLFLLHRRGVSASLGGGAHQKLADLLIACGHNPYTAECALSFALSLTTTQSDIERAIEVITGAALHLRKCHVAASVE